MNPADSILLAEDDEADVLLILRAFRDAGLESGIRVVRDGQECIAALRNEISRGDTGEVVRLPCLLLLDLKMPRLTGMDVLRWRHSDPIARTVSAIVFSSSGNQSDVELAYALGATGFLVKPSSTAKRTALARLIKAFWLESNQPPLACTEGVKVARTFLETNVFEQSLL